MARLDRRERELLASTALRILDNWGVGDGQQRRLLGDLDEEIYAGWRAGVFRSMPKPALRRALLLLGIHRGLRLMFRDPVRGYAWMSRANAIFDGATPLDLIASGDLHALLRLRDYLAAQSQPW